MVIMEHFKARSCSWDQPETVFIINRRSTNITCHQSTTNRESGPLVHDLLKSQVPHIYKTTLADFNLIFMCSTIVLGNTGFFIFIDSQHEVFKIFSSLERRSKAPSKLCIETSFFLPYYIYAVSSDICYV